MKNILEDKSELPIDLLNTSTEVSSGQHMPAGQMMWSKPTISINEVDDEEVEDEDITKEALGLTDIPTSIYGGEVLEFKGTPQNPGLSRTEGEGEETDYFGASADVSDLPPVNELDLEGSEKEEPENPFIDFMYQKEIMAMFEDLNNLQKRWGKNNFMKAELQELEEYLNKKAGISGGMAGSAAGVLSSLLPGLSIVPLPVKALVGGIAGSGIENYFMERPKAKTNLEQVAEQVNTLRISLQNYGVTEYELNKLSSHALNAHTLTDTMIQRGARMPANWIGPIQKLAEQYIVASDKLVALFQQAHNEVVPKTEVQTQTQTETSAQIAPSRKPEAFSARGKITRPGDPYTYDKDPASDAYVVVSAPPGKESLIGRKIQPGAPGYDLIKAADPGSKPIAMEPKDVAREAFVRGQELAAKKDYAGAIQAYQESFDALPTANALFNIGKAQYDSGDASSALDTFTKYQTQYPDEWTKNQGLIPQSIKDMMTKPIAEESPAESIPEQYKPTKEKIAEVLTSFLNGVPIRMQTPEGTTTAMDSRRVRRLTENYIKAISAMKDPQEGLSLTATGIADEFGSAITEGIQKVLTRENISTKQLEGIFNGLVWQALRKGWAKWKNAPLKNQPTQQSQERHTRQVERQDQRLQNQSERQARRENAKREARKMMVEELHKVARK